MNGGDFHMVTLCRIRYAATGKKSAPKKGGLAALILHHRKIDMKGYGIVGIKAEGIHNTADLILFKNLKRKFAGSGQTGETVKIHIKAPFK